eukprot:TRINITY_DN13167_c0_g1_i12.p1 TRINITY_DN13167_c0_g1~~TRINITY_DN13167_c0_g1_i12.p1  ORF type:complete len:441 (+),score=82.23 TRINITY_DN13167_c0_g1_i12:273-1595(+)
MFDTGQAARFLNMPSFSLAYLLNHFCKVIANKQYQLADWRVRPIPAEMLRYAREDTHYLLYIYDMLRSVLNRSKEISLKKYKKPILETQGYYNILQRNKGVVSNKRYNCLAKMLKWRDEIGRQEDESPHYLLPNNILFQILDIFPTSSLVEIFVKASDNPAELAVAERRGDGSKEQQEESAIVDQEPGSFEEWQRKADLRLPELETEEEKAHHTLTRYDFTVSFQKLSITDKAGLKGKANKSHPNLWGSRDRENNPKVSLVKESFNYTRVFDVMFERFPKYQAAIIQSLKDEAQRKKDEENRPRKLDIEASAEKPANDEENQIEFIPFTKEKGEQSQKKEKEYSIESHMKEYEKKVPVAMDEQRNLKFDKKKRRVEKQDLEAPDAVKKLKTSDEGSARNWMMRSPSNSRLTRSLTSRISQRRSETLGPILPISGTPTRTT